MATRKVLKIRPVLVTLNILVLLLIVLFYCVRLIKYYRLEHKNSNNESIAISETLIAKQEYLETNNGLIYDEELKTYRYKGNINDNYLSYSGMMFRIISIDENNNIKLISEDNLTLMYSGLEKGYSSSYVNKWLNTSEDAHSGIFDNVLYEKDSLLTKTTLCEDNINDTNSITCDKINKNNNVTLLSLYDYIKCGGKNSFLNNGNSFYLSSLNDSNNNYYVENTGEVTLNYSNTKLIGVRAVITLKGSDVVISGNGKKSSPYIIEEHEIKSLNKVYVGSYVTFSNNTYRVIEVNEDKVKVALDGIIKDNDEEVAIKFSSDSNSYSSNTNIGIYLNKTFYNTLVNTDYIISSNWYTDKLELTDLDYSLVYNEKSKNNIGLLGLSDFYVQDINNVFTLSKGIEDDTIINVINSEGNVYGDLITSKYNLRPAFYLNGKLSIVSGIGSEYGPYVIGENESEEN